MEILKYQQDALDQVITAEDTIRYYLPGDYADAYEFRVQTQKQLSAKDIMEAFWIDQPKFAVRMMALSNKLMAHLDIKTGQPPIEEWLATGIRAKRYYDFGMVIDEMTITAYDKHLDFHLSIKSLGGQGLGQKRLVVTTVVKFHNALGKRYFAVIKPWHGQLLKKTMKHVLAKRI